MGRATRNVAEILVMMDTEVEVTVAHKHFLLDTDYYFVVPKTRLCWVWVRRFRCTDTSTHQVLS